ncbi:beta-hydroxyacyl-ACP dehydratase [Parabacteroides bouchesdurhonensis]|uniref:beta-hydroxyacyl-ACP dehydratase n=1 Tax=Parabacteroides bouchesdurhonensis TaxID=1936995 RepID=UPI000C85AC41|nr:beta-hydroxyacyl-ACP dehydratase [Parabacteroides bouchesdurhonensis]
MKNEDIKKLIPQRDPILMVDKLLEADSSKSLTSLTVRADNYFIGEDGKLEESGLIEHIAQSASAFAGYMAVEKGATEPPVGYIGEIRKFCCYHRPRVGDELVTTIIIGAEVGGVTSINGESRVQGKLMAETQMKIYIRP